MANDQMLTVQEIMDLALIAGLFSHQSGGDTNRTSGIIRRMALALGATRADTVISSINIGVTVEKNGMRETAFRKAPHMGANFAMLTAVAQVVDSAEAGLIDASEVRRQLDQIAQHPHFYPRWLIAATVGLSCGGFAALFGGDATAIACTTLGSGIGMALRLFLHKHHYVPFMFALASSFTAMMVTGLLLKFAHSEAQEAAMAASVLFLIPGVPFINGAADLFGTNYLNGMVRIMMGIIFVIGIATGVSLALRIL
ncbi:MAG: threonine/serine exporter family protein [Formivibrio sp.]|nr:threonine/serine exporter family protein [Formivibrio sp.]